MCTMAARLVVTIACVYSLPHYIAINPLNATGVNMYPVLVKYYVKLMKTMALRGLNKEE